MLYGEKSWSSLFGFIDLADEKEKRPRIANSAGCGLRTMGENRIGKKSMCRDPLQSQFECALAPNPNHLELRFLLTHLYVENLSDPNFPPYSLDHQPPGAHIGYQGRIHKRLAMGIHSPNLHWKLDFNSWALASIHGTDCPLEMIDWKLTRVTANRVPECECKRF